MRKLLHEIASCAAHLSSGPHPIEAAHEDSKIVVIGQAPGAVVHRTGIPWDDLILQQMKKVLLILLLGSFAQNYYLPNKNEKTLTATVKKYSEYLPQYFVLPHPSPRNNIWMAKNKWFKTEALPHLKREVKKALQSL